LSHPHSTENNFPIKTFLNAGDVKKVNTIVVGETVALFLCLLTQHVVFVQRADKQQVQRERENVRVREKIRKKYFIIVVITCT
jgi:hypothetical protein